ncbi:PorP/SprF family type IX secretion system membrane protein [Geofilum sp. OHC36d9]|uniref:PorP/SprF family type IX secretion system membrane protein n=1 Tax=Geofilum sp. OHC36d9 TaxID=3458413 RepID=UPI0040343781
MRQLIIADSNPSAVCENESGRQQLSPFTMVKRYLILLGVIMVSSLGLINAQNQYSYNHYIANQGLLNPAYNGTRDVISGLFLHRNQWIGVEGAPMLDALNVHGPIEGTNIGVGASFVNDHIGFSNTFDFMGSGSYRIMMDRNKKFLSFGLQLGFNSIAYDGTQAVTGDYGDPVFNGKMSKLYFNAGFGSYFYSEDYFVGFSVPKFFSNSYNKASEDFKNTLDFKNLHMYLYGGYVFDWGAVKVKPTLLMKEVYGAPLQFDISANVLLAEKIWVGASYRTTTDVVFLLEYIINRQFTVRYSGDYSFDSINKYAQAGSHEIGIQFDFTFNKRPGMRSIRYF